MYDQQGHASQERQNQLLLSKFLLTPDEICPGFDTHPPETFAHFSTKRKLRYRLILYNIGVVAAVVVGFYTRSTGSTSGLCGDVHVPSARVNAEPEQKNKPLIGSTHLTAEPFRQLSLTEWLSRQLQ